LAYRVAEDRHLLAMLAPLSRPKQQPNLLLAAVRLLCGTPSGWEEFRACVEAHREEVLATTVAHRTQTNEPARCATLLPLLARLPPPLALLEVGASAGLCLLTDRYGYDYGGHQVEPVQHPGVEPPIFACRASLGTPLPSSSSTRRCWPTWPITPSERRSRTPSVSSAPYGSRTRRRTCC